MICSCNKRDIVNWVVLVILVIITYARAECTVTEGTVEHPDNPERLCRPEIIEFTHTNNKTRLWAKADRFANFMWVEYKHITEDGIPLWLIITNPPALAANVRPGDIYGFVIPTKLKQTQLRLVIQ